MLSQIPKKSHILPRQTGMVECVIFDTQDKIYQIPVMWLLASPWCYASTCQNTESPWAAGWQAESHEVQHWTVLRCYRCGQTGRKTTCHAWGANELPAHRHLKPQYSPMPKMPHVQIKAQCKTATKMFHIKSGTFLWLVFLVTMLQMVHFNCIYCSICQEPPCKASSND